MTDNTTLANKIFRDINVTLRDALERGVEDIAGCVPSLANVAAPWWHCALKRAYLGLLEFGSEPSSAERPPPLVRAEEVSAPLEGSIRTTRRAPMRAEVEVSLETSGEGQRGQGRPSPLSRPFSSLARPRARKLCRSTYLPGQKKLPI